MSRVVLGVADSVSSPKTLCGFCPVITLTPPSLCDSFYHRSFAHVYLSDQRVVIKHLLCPRRG